MGGRVFQVIDTLDARDGTSEVARIYAPILAACGAEPSILTLRTHESIRAETRPLESVVWRRDDAAIVHIRGFTRLERFLETFPGRKAIYFQNITPPEFFASGSLRYRETRAGWTQVPRLAELADVWLAPSRYNLAALASLAPASRPQRVVPPPIDPGVERGRPLSAACLRALRAREEINFLFVGRLAANKQQERVMEVFDYYHARINRRSRLHLVGSASSDPRYASALMRLRSRLASRDAIELPGTVPDDELHAYYRAADLFLCLSQHEGFCLPPLIAAAHGVPVLAQAAAALPETIGPAAVLLHRYDPARIAELAHAILEDSALRERLREAAARHFARFAPDAVKGAWGLALAELRQ